MPDCGRPIRLALSHLWQQRKFRYLAIGASNTVAGYLIFASIYYLFGNYTGYLLAVLVSHIIAVSLSFTTQRNLVFYSTGEWKKEYLRFNITHLGSLGVNLSLLPLLVECLYFDPLAGQAVVTSIIVVTSYFLHQHFTFRKAEDV